MPVTMPTNHCFQRVIAPFFSAIALLLLANVSFADSAVINCTDIGGDNESCTLESSGGASSQGMLGLVGDLINAINNNEVDDSDCVRQGNDVTCNLLGTELTLDCTVEDGDTSTGTCTLNNLPAEFLSLDCEASETEGQCTLQNQSEGIASYLETSLGAGITANEFSVLTNIVSGCGFQGGTSAFQRDCNTLLNVLANGSSSQIQNLLDEITPKNVDAAADTNVFKAQQLAGTIRQRLARVRAGKTGVDTTALRYFDGTRWLQAGDMVASNEGDTMTDTSPSDLNTLAESEKFGVFIDGALVNTEFDGSDDENGADTDEQTLTFGFDYRLSPQMIAGLALSMSTSGTDYADNRGELDSENYTLVGYGSYYQGAWYVDATIGMGGDRYDQQRNIDCTVASCGTAFSNQLEADYYGDQFSFTLGGGYDISYGQWAMTPFVQYASTTVNIDDYNESATNTAAPGAGYALAMDEQERDSATFTLGSDLRYTLSQEWGVLVPYVGIEFINETEDDAVIISGRFLGNVSSDAQFELSTGEIDSSYAYLSVGASAAFAGGGAAFIDIRSLQGYDDAEQIRFTGGYRMAF